MPRKILFEYEVPQSCKKCVLSGLGALCPITKLPQSPTVCDKRPIHCPFDNLDSPDVIYGLKENGLKIRIAKALVKRISVDHGEVERAGDDIGFYKYILSDAVKDLALDMLGMKVFTIDTDFDPMMYTDDVNISLEILKPTEIKKED